MPKHVVVLGAGFGGLELVTGLSESIPDKVPYHPHRQERFVHLRFLETRRHVWTARSECRSSLIRRSAKPGVQFRQETSSRSKRPPTSSPTWRPTTLMSLWWRSAPTTTWRLPRDWRRTESSSILPGGAERAGRPGWVWRGRGGDWCARAVLQVSGGAERDGASGTRFLGAAWLPAELDHPSVSPLPMPIPISKRTSEVIMEILAAPGSNTGRGLVTRLDPTTTGGLRG